MTQRRRLSAAEAQDRIENDERQPFLSGALKRAAGSMEAAVSKAIADAADELAKPDGRKRSASKGAYYKGRSKAFLINTEKDGTPTRPGEPQYQVSDMEIVKNIFTPRGRMGVKRDQLGSDLLYLDLKADVVVFLQVKSGHHSTEYYIREAEKGFEPYTFPKHSRREVHVWKLRAQRPIIHIVK